MSISEPMDILAPFLVRDKVALITGASSGFGLHFASVLASVGAKVVLTARRGQLLESACEDLRAQGAQAMAVTMDVTDTDSIKAAFDAIEETFGIVNILVNNAGIVVPRHLLEMSDTDWHSVIDTNLNGVMYVTREAAQRLVAKGEPGSIVNVASILGERVQQGVSNYAAAKAAVKHFTKATALEFARYNIRVNALCPGYFNTELNGDWFKTDPGQDMIRRIPQRRTGEMHELNGPLLLLASDAGSLMTGSMVTVDGGHVLTTL
ncbi:MAG: SDR family NAD(P)-dependent oxidoreductase [Pseudomonadales bacterium]